MDACNLCYKQIQLQWQVGRCERDGSEDVEQQSHDESNSDSELGIGLSQDLGDDWKEEERGERKGMQRNTRGQKSAGNSSRQPLRTGSTLVSKASPHWVLVQMQMWKRERQSGRAARWA